MESTAVREPTSNHEDNSVTISDASDQVRRDVGPGETRRWTRGEETLDQGRRDVGPGEMRKRQWMKKARESLVRPLMLGIWQVVMNPLVFSSMEVHHKCQGLVLHLPGYVHRCTLKEGYLQDVEERFLAGTDGTYLREGEMKAEEGQPDMNPVVELHAQTYSRLL